MKYIHINSAGRETAGPGQAGKGPGKGRSKLTTIHNPVLSKLTHSHPLWVHEEGKQARVQGILYTGREADVRKKR